MDDIALPTNKRVEYHNCCARCKWMEEDEDEESRPFWYCLRELTDDGAIVSAEYVDDRPALPYFMVCDGFEKGSEGA